MTTPEKAAEEYAKEAYRTLWNRNNPAFNDGTSYVDEMTGGYIKRAFLAGYATAQKELIEVADEWCGINAYDSDKGACDEHTVDDCRGVVCSANELRYYLEALAKGNI